MTVKEFIKKLKKEDQKAEVFFINCDGQFEEVGIIGKVKGENLSGNFPSRIVAISGEHYSYEDYQ